VGALALPQQQQADTARSPRIEPRIAHSPPHSSPWYWGWSTVAALLPPDHPAQGIYRARRPQPHPHSSPARAARAWSSTFIIARWSTTRPSFDAVMVPEGRAQTLSKRFARLEGYLGQDNIATKLTQAEDEGRPPF